MKSITLAAIITAALAGCDRQDAHPMPQPLPKVLDDDLKLLSDQVYQGKDIAFTTYKVDMGQPGSYAILVFNDNSSALHYYVGNGHWQNVEGDLNGNLWLQGLRADMYEKIKKGETVIESVPYHK